MTKLAALVVKIADLAEAEGRSLLAVARAEGARLHTSVSSLAVAIAFLAAGTLLALCGVALLAFGAFLSIEQHLGRPAAAAITGLAFLIAAGICAWMFKQKTTQ